MQGAGSGGHSPGNSRGRWRFLRRMVVAPLPLRVLAPTLLPALSAVVVPPEWLAPPSAAALAPALVDTPSAPPAATVGECLRVDRCSSRDNPRLDLSRVCIQGLQRDNRLRPLRPRRAHTVGYIGVCDCRTGGDLSHACIQGLQALAVHGDSHASWKTPPASLPRRKRNQAKA